MGARGSFSLFIGRTGGIVNMEYSTIGMLGRIKVIQCDTKTNNPTPTYSNTVNTTYYSYSKESGRIEHIFYYRDHRLVKSVDFKLGEIPHTHYWSKSGLVGRKKHNKSNIHKLSDRDMRLYKQAMDFNNKKS